MEVGEEQKTKTPEVTSALDFSKIGANMSQNGNETFVENALPCSTFFGPDASRRHFRPQGTPRPQNDTKMTAKSNPKRPEFN